jgi:hypothetical protein
MNKFDYISILAGGSCKFSCDFCIGNKIRENTKPHFSTKLSSFIECFSDMTDLLSVSGDTSDPSFVTETKDIPKIAKSFNSNIKVTLHSRNIKYLDKVFDYGYDKFVFSTDEDFYDNCTQEDIFNLIKIKDKLRFSIVVTSFNFGYMVGEELLISKLSKDFPNAQITLRPEVSESEHIIKCLESIGTWVPMENSAMYLKENKNVWLWDYNQTNSKLNVRYLFSTGNISSNCEWDRIASK